MALGLYQAGRTFQLPAATCLQLIHVPGVCLFCVWRQHTALGDIHWQPCPSHPSTPRSRQQGHKLPVTSKWQTKECLGIALNSGRFLFFCCFFFNLRIVNTWKSAVQFRHSWSIIDGSDTEKFKTDISHLLGPFFKMAEIRFPYLELIQWFK